MLLNLQSSILNLESTPFYLTPVGRSRCTRLLSELLSTSIRSKSRLVRGAFLRRLWLFIPLTYITLPVPVILKRRLAPLWVFILGIGCSSSRRERSRTPRPTARARRLVRAAGQAGRSCGSAVSGAGRASSG